MPEERVSGQPIGGPAKSKRAAAGRVCKEPECTTPLSTYNLNDRCSVHRDNPCRTSPGNQRRSLESILKKLG